MLDAGQGWSIQFSLENGNDAFDTPSVNGLKQTRMNQFAIDASYALSFRWALNGYLSRGVQTFNQSRNAGYAMAFENTNTNIGLGFTGKPSNEFEVGGNLTYVDDKSQYVQALDAGPCTRPRRWPLQAVYRTSCSSRPPSSFLASMRWTSRLRFAWT